MTHTLIRVMIRLLGGEKSSVPEPLHIQRPGEESPRLTWAQMARRAVGR